MDINAQHTFDHPIDKVWAMFTDQDSHVAKFESMGHRDIEVIDYRNDGDEVVIKIRRTVDVDLPGFAKKVMKPTNTVETTDTWRDLGDGTYGGDFIVDAKGAPIDARGTTRLRPAGDKTDYEVKVVVKVKVPIIGGKIEGWAKGDIVKQFDDEFAAGDAWLTSH